LFQISFLPQHFVSGISVILQFSLFDGLSLLHCGLAGLCQLRGASRATDGAIHNDGFFQRAPKEDE
jgi:hypothetical protein